ncbi:MAG: ABC transporter ATP-binding protein [Planctomycetaceae bacterium]
MISVQDLTAHAGQFRLDRVSFEIPSGAYGVLMGATGTGKTTLLEAVLGLRRISSGGVWLYGCNVTQLDPAARGIGYVPQDGALFSHLTVREQVGFSLAIRRASRQDICDRTDELAQLLGITPLLDRYPPGLSGGERQRVALGRALAFRPRVLCLDEPLSALDSETRRQMCQLLRTVQQQTGVTALHVTHNLDEAELLADCLLRIEAGQVCRQTSVNADIS